MLSLRGGRGGGVSAVRKHGSVFVRWPCHLSISHVFFPEERAAGLLFSGTPMECHVQVDRAYGNSKKNTIHRASQLQHLLLDVVGDEELDASHEGRSIGARSAAGLLTRHCKIAA